MNEQNTPQRGDDERSKMQWVKSDPQLNEGLLLSGINTKSLTTLRTELNRARNEYRLGQDQEAIAKVNKLLSSLDQTLLEASPVGSREQSQRSLLYAASLTVLGRCYERQKKVQDAQEAFAQAVKLFDQWLAYTEPTGSDYGDYGLALYKVGREVDAEQALRKAMDLKNTTAETYYYLALCLQKKGLYSKAEQLLREAIEVAVDPGPIYQKLGEVLEAQQLLNDALNYYQQAVVSLLSNERWDEAMVTINHILTFMPTTTEGLIEKGEILRLLGRHEEALATLDQAVALNPNDVNVLGEKGQALRALSRDAEAAEILQRAVQLDPTQDWLYVELGASLYNLNRYDEALAALDRALELNPNDTFTLGIKGQALRALSRDAEAAEILQRTVQLDPTQDRLYAELGASLYNLNRYDEALAALDRALELNPNSAFTLGVKGQVLLSQNHLNEAINTLQRAKELNPNLSWVYITLSIAFQGLNRNDEALSASRQALKLDPNDAQACWAQGEALRMQNNFEEALQSYNRALQITPTYIEALIGKGYCWLALDHNLEGIMSIKQAVDLEPENVWVLVEMAFALRVRGNTSEFSDDDDVIQQSDDSPKDDYEEALLYLDKALAIDPKYVAALNIKGDLLSDIAEYQAAVTVLEKAIELDQHMAVLFASKGWALENLGVERAQDTREAYEKAIALNPEDLWSHKGLAETLILMGDIEEARSKYLWVIEQATPNLKLDINTIPLIGWCRYRLGEYEEAVHLYKGMLSFTGTDLSSQFDLGLALTCNKRFGLALHEYKQGLEIVTTRGLGRRGLLFIAINDLRDAMKEKPELSSETAVQQVLELLELAYQKAMSETVPSIQDHLR